MLTEAGIASARCCTENVKIRELHSWLELAVWQLRIEGRPDSGLVANEYFSVNLAS